jgi:hypothetical protein
VATGGSTDIRIGPRRDQHAKRERAKHKGVM